MKYYRNKQKKYKNKFKINWNKEFENCKTLEEYYEKLKIKFNQKPSKIERKRTEYENILKSDKWKEFRDKYIKDKCEACPKHSRLNLHHFTYKNGIYDNNSVITLCIDCHRKVHKLRDTNPHFSLHKATFIVVNHTEI